ncbi:MAG TPA: tetratricopeptide repeat protein [Terriglobales bacterium]|nr:tetratricopeptide repeat protein [Terriglobales bacterium]
MSQRVTLNRQSFEQFLAATCLLLQLRQESRRHEVEDSHHADEIVDDVYVPGIGVRAALGGDDFAQSSKLWTTVRDKSACATQIAYHCARSLFGSARSAGLRLSSGAGNAFGKLPRHASLAAKFPSAAHEFLLRSLHGGKSVLVKFGDRLHLPRRSPACQVPNLLASSEAHACPPIEQTGAMQQTQPIPRNSARRQMLRAQSSLLDVWKSVDLQFRKVLRYQPKLPGERKWTQELHRWQPQFGSWSIIKTAAHQSLTKRRFKLDLKDIGRFAPAWAVLVIILLFVAMEQGMHKSSPSSAPMALDTAQASTLPISGNIGQISPKPQPAQSKIRQAGKSMARVSGHRVANHPFQLSHLQITDPDTDIELRDMTRYEIAKLQKDAQSGDDVAAFQLGMAYETGYDLPQNCAQAAKWVARSAAHGDAAAEYNLGLRYRDGDGVTANPAEAEKWLRQAAAQKNSEAQLALVALTTHQARGAVSQP